MDLPIVSAYFPVSQSLQLETPTPDMVPLAHGVHIVRAVTGAYFPAVQFTHSGQVGPRVTTRLVHYTAQESHTVVRAT